MNKKQNKYKVAQPFLLALMVAIGMLAGYQLNQVERGNLIRFFPGEKEITIGRVEEVLRFLDSKYLYEPDSEKLTDDALFQVFSNLDPYSVYIAPSELEGVNNTMNGHYKGIGIETIFVRDTLLVAKVLEGSPAEEAGLKPMDRIIALNGEDFTGDNLDFPKFRKHFMEQNESSELSVLRKRSGERIKLSVFAEQVETKSVGHHFMLNDTTLYVRIDQFISKTYREFMEVLEKRQIDGKIPAIVLDLRNNPGGYLGEVTKILSQFFDDSEKLLVRTQVRNGRERTYETTGRTFYEVGRIIVLQNGESASGSEVLAGALQDWDRGLILGKQSYGKGLVQEQYNLSNGGAVRLTVANYYLPSGRSIQHSFEIDSTFFEGDSVWTKANNAYSSMIHKRNLTGANGIIPDQSVSDSLYDNWVYPAFFRNSRLDELVISYIENHRDLYTLEKEEFFSNFELKNTEHSLDSLQAVFSELDLPLLNNMMRAKLAYYLYEDDRYLEILMGNDPLIELTKEKLEEEEWFNDTSS